MYNQILVYAIFLLTPFVDPFFIYTFTSFNKFYLFYNYKSYYNQLYHYTRTYVGRINFITTVPTTF